LPATPDTETTAVGLRTKGNLRPKQPKREGSCCGEQETSFFFARAQNRDNFSDSGRID
jgi:hypothetical protein